MTKLGPARGAKPTKCPSAGLAPNKALSVQWRACVSYAVRAVLPRGLGSESDVSDVLEMALALHARMRLVLADTWSEP